MQEAPGFQDSTRFPKSQCGVCSVLKKPTDERGIKSTCWEGQVRGVGFSESDSSGPNGSTKSLTSSLDLSSGAVDAGDFQSWVTSQKDFGLRAHTTTHLEEMTPPREIQLLIDGRFKKSSLVD